MSVVAIVQARMSSTRLPGKVLFDLEGIPVLEHICLRLKSCKRVDKIVVATSNEHTDDQIYEWGKKRIYQYSEAA